MVEINPREVAADVLLEIEKEKAYSNIALKRALKRNGAMSAKERAFVTEIVNGVLRNMYHIDAVLNWFSTVKTKKMKPFLLAALRSGVYQILFMERVPDGAACNETVNIVKKRGFGSLSGFTNGVLRNIAKNREAVLFPDENTNPAAYLETVYSHPQWLVKMWLSQYPYSFVKELCAKNNTPPDVTVVVNCLKSSPSQVKKELEEAGVHVKDGKYCPQALHLTNTADLSKNSSFLNGDFYIQDESSMLAVMALDARPGEKVLDVCAAPGGKALFIGQRMQNQGFLLARDIYPHKLELMEENKARLGVSVMKTQLWDAEEQDQSYRQYFDRVLVDAPCSGLGLIRKKPDIRYAKTGEDIDKLLEIQKQILQASWDYVKPGGVLVYSTCTICRKENIGMIQWFLERYPYILEDLTPYLGENLDCETEKDGYVQLFPHIHQTDGFFIARLRRKE